jgi:hypothetical protein
MRIYLLLFLFFISASFSFGQEKSKKRGVGYGYHSTADMNTASQGISWWYNWAAQPDVAIRNTYGNYNVDFTPQAWNASGITGVNSWVSQDEKVNYVLGFNEPNFTAQANMTPSQAAAAWPQLQAIADQYGLKLVSPAVNYCGSCVTENGTTYNNPFDWLDDFFTACVGCRVDYIALHWYGGGNSMSGYIDDARKYGKPIWVTEFANWDAGVTPESQKNYLAGTVNFLERDPDIFRYAWFIGRGSGVAVYPYIDLYGANGEMTELGQIYLDIPVYDSTQIFEIPGRIEAEEYYQQKGVFAELTNDTDGFMNIGYTEAGNWLKYKIDVAESGNYAFTSRYAGTAAGKFDVYLDDIKVGTVNTTNTNGWQNWKSVSVTINLEAGEHILKIAVLSSGFNLNWMGFEKGFAGLDDPTMSQLDVTVFPNPIVDYTFTIRFNRHIADEFTVQIIDLTGNTIYTTEIAGSIENEVSVDLSKTDGMRKGIYTLCIICKEGSVFRKIVLL